MNGLNLSAFDIIGPAMVGPSSSHTAGAVRIGLIARRLLGDWPRRAIIQLHGSFAATGRGHATDRALIAGLLGSAPDDESIPDSLEKARNLGLDFTFETVDLGDAFHPNSVRIQLNSRETHVAVIGSSLGGGVVEIVELDGYPAALKGDRPMLVCWHKDISGFLSRLTGAFAACDANIATLATKRTRRGGDALTVAETDFEIGSDVLARLATLAGLTRYRYLPPLT